MPEYRNLIVGPMSNKIQSTDEYKLVVGTHARKLGVPDTAWLPVTKKMVGRTVGSFPTNINLRRPVAEPLTEI